MQKIVFIHSLNNYTGSPNILSIVVKGLIQRGYEAEIITSSGEGFLSDIEGAGYRYTCYRWCKSSAQTMLRLMLSQAGVFFSCLFGSKRHIYYINTIVPFGAIIACWLTRKRYVIHVHENMRQRKPLYRFLKQVYWLCNQKTVFVSNYLARQAVGCRDGIVAANALPDAFFDTARNYLQLHPERTGESILMIASLRRFKGIFEFAELAGKLPDFSFELALSAEIAEVECFKSETGLIPNLIVYASQANLHPFYQRARLLLQLSHPKDCVETFGLTILEAMTYGIPTIVPNVGGPAELVEDGVNGYTVDPLNLSYISKKIEELMNDDKLHKKLSDNALQKSKQYMQTGMITKIEGYLK